MAGDSCDEGSCEEGSWDGFFVEIESPEVMLISFVSASSSR
jgi:hypothetical protein